MELEQLTQDDVRRWCMQERLGRVLSDVVQRARREKGEAGLGSIEELWQAFAHGPEAEREMGELEGLSCREAYAPPPPRAHKRPPSLACLTCRRVRLGLSTSGLQLDHSQAAAAAAGA